MDLISMSNTILFSAAVNTIKELVVAAVTSRISLRGVNLRGVDLRGVNLRGVDLCGVDLRGANLRGADLRGADLYGANLREANLRGVDLCGVDLRGANLRGADLYEVNLRGANLREADLYEVNLRGADLRGVDLRGAKNLSELIAAESNILPIGSIIGWKKCQNNVIVKLLIPSKARKSNASGRKCRAEYVKVLQVFGAEIGISTHNPKTIYRKGETVACDTWNENRWIECGGGIHFFISRIEAENY